LLEVKPTKNVYLGARNDNTLSATTILINGWNLDIAGTVIFNRHVVFVFARPARIGQAENSSKQLKEQV
jgi:hypothetical protein